MKAGVIKADVSGMRARFENGSAHNAVGSERTVQPSRLANVSDMKQKFVTGQANNAQGTRLQHTTEQDEALARAAEEKLHFQFKDSTIEAQRKRDEEASLQLALQLQAEEDAAIAASLRFN